MGVGVRCERGGGAVAGSGRSTRRRGCGVRAESLRTKDEDGGLDRPTTQLGWAEPDVPWARARDGLEFGNILTVQIQAHFLNIKTTSLTKLILDQSILEAPCVIS